MCLLTYTREKTMFLVKVFKGVVHAFMYIATIFILILSLFVGWMFYSSVADTYQFWQYGVEKNASVVALDHISKGNRGPTTYYYELNIDNYNVIEGFRYELPVGDSITVLTLPDEKDKVSLANSDSGPFQIYSYSAGGDLMAFITLITYVTFFFVLPNLVVQVFKSKKKSF